MDMLGTLFRLCPGKPKEREPFVMRYLPKGLAGVFLKLKPTNFGNVSREFLKQVQTVNLSAVL